MNKELYDNIYKRKSFHLFRNIGKDKITEAEKQDILEAYKTFVPLYPDIRTAIKIVPASETNCRRGEEYCILMYSEVRDNHLLNIGYLGEQLDLYLVSKNIGSLWFGIGKTEEKEYDGLSFVIMIAISKVDDEKKFRKDMFKSRRKATEDIWQGNLIKGVTEIAKYAPSACNSQPWEVRNTEVLEVYRYRKPGFRGIMPAKMVPFYNRVDMGIYLCFLELCLEHEGYHFERELFTDDGDDRLYTLTAKYRLSENMEEKE